MENIRTVVAENIIALRRRDNITQAELAEKLNYSDKAVSKWERGESLPDIAVLKAIAELFDVSIDYLTEAEHASPAPVKLHTKKHNCRFIIALCIMLVWLIATSAFVVINTFFPHIKLFWLSFVYAVPVSLIVWLILNSIWFDRRKNFLIISFLMWSVLIAVFLHLLAIGLVKWQIFVLGAPGQAIILFWSRLKRTNMK